jgi:hypothetical protein
MAILEPKYYIVIYRTSYFCLLSAVYAFYRKHYYLSIGPASIFLTSIHYWKNPDYSYRRYLDMVVVKTVLACHIYLARNAQFWKEYYIMLFLACLSYPIGIYYYKKNDHCKSTFFHILVHVIGNIGNIILYSGLIE